MKRCGLIGDPVEHSLSPVMQSVAFRETGVSASYELWPTAVADVPERVASLRQAGFLGANVTVPHKQRVVSECDEIADTARRIGAVNTIIHRDGRLLGDNTDVYGFEMTIRSAGVDVGTDDTAVLLGAGGAARAVIVALQRVGFDRIVIVNRSPARANALAVDLGTGNDISVVNPEGLGAVLPDTALLVNATSLGWHLGEMPVGASLLDALPGNAMVADLTYRDTDLLRESRGRGLTAVDGLMMLIYQGARSFTLWTGVEAPVGAMRAAVEDEQRRRARA